MKISFIALAICLGVWIIIVLTTSHNQATSDGFNEIGFPLMFYREFYGKGNYAELELGINYKNLIIDLALVLLLSLGLTKLLSKRKA